MTRYFYTPVGVTSFRTFLQGKRVRRQRFYTPVGVTSSRTAIGKDELSGNPKQFLYASRRDVIQDSDKWKPRFFVLEFLYASRRDVIQDPTLRTMPPKILVSIRQ